MGGKPSSTLGKVVRYLMYKLALCKHYLLSPGLVIFAEAFVNMCMCINLATPDY